MNFLLDTNVISESVKPQPNRDVIEWLAGADEDRLYLSVMTSGELRQGLEKLEAGTRRERLNEWIRLELPQRFEGRILDVGVAIADHWGVLIARSLREGTNLGVLDALFAATAVVHGLILVTRNTKHFEALGIPLINPWTGNK